MCIASNLVNTSFLIDINKFKSVKLSYICLLISLKSVFEVTYILEHLSICCRISVLTLWRQRCTSPTYNTLLQIFTQGHFAESAAELVDILCEFKLIGTV